MQEDAKWRSDTQSMQNISHSAWKGTLTVGDRGEREGREREVGTEKRERRGWGGKAGEQTT